MTREDWLKKYYRQSVTNGVDELSLFKGACSDWVEISMETNGKANTVTIRSKEHAESLYFMLGQLLEKP